jgi:hypothetical protein
MLPQVPFVQVCPPGQALPHIPQCAALVCTSVHAPLHVV